VALEPRGIAAADDDGFENTITLPISHCGTNQFMDVDEAGILKGIIGELRKTRDSVVAANEK